jgi:hypothetical protein
MAALGLLLILATPVLGVEEGGQGEGCPAGTSLLVTFTWDGSAFTPDGGDPMGVAVSGDADLAFFTSGQAISALVLTAGVEARNIALDAPETLGSVSPHNYEVFGGASISSLGFCTGAKADPDSGSSASIEVAKTATCATLNQDGTATVTGTVDVYNHHPRAIRVTSALDSVFAPDDTALGRAVVDGLIGLELAPEAVASVPYTVTFDPAGGSSFTNFVDITIERADSGEARHKIYNARAQFGMCAVTVTPPTPPQVTPPTPPQTGGEQPQESPRGTVAGGNPTPSPGPLPDTSMAGGSTTLPAAILALIFVASIGLLGYRTAVEPLR